MLALSSLTGMVELKLNKQFTIEMIGNIFFSEADEKEYIISFWSLLE